jgi:hypothetical protein
MIEKVIERLRPSVVFVQNHHRCDPDRFWHEGGSPAHSAAPSLTSSRRGGQDDDERVARLYSHSFAISPRVSREVYVAHHRFPKRETQRPVPACRFGYRLAR